MYTDTLEPFYLYMNCENNWNNNILCLYYFSFTKVRLPSLVSSLLPYLMFYFVVSHDLKSQPSSVVGPSFRPGSVSFHSFVNSHSSLQRLHSQKKSYVNKTRSLRVPSPPLDKVGYGYWLLRDGRVAYDTIDYSLHPSLVLRTLSGPESLSRF